MPRVPTTIRCKPFRAQSRLQSRFSRGRVPLLQLGGVRRETIDDDRHRLIFSEKGSWADDREARFLRHDSVCTILTTSSIKRLVTKLSNNEYEIFRIFSSNYNISY